LELAKAELLAMLMQLTPFCWRGVLRWVFRRELVLTWAIRLWYRVAAITMASSVLLQMNPWHSSTLGELAERMTTAKMGACTWMLCSTASFSLELQSRCGKITINIIE